MGPRELFSEIIAVLFRYRTFWSRLKENPPADETSLLREYAVPVIALVQLAKFPLIGVPRTAMFYAIANFLIDVAALYIFVGAATYLAEHDRSANSPSGILAVISFSMTPVWISELLYFAGPWSWLSAAVGILYAIVISRHGLVAYSGLEPGVSGNAMRNITLMQLLTGGTLFLVLRAVMRLFNFI
ncbi:MAG: hypothetical protein HGA62_07770 [Chlorobiaceae bacterium]|nr:hypothetical protein [Chlorobiaceae bacterium]NTV59990.1 hypothetical protein [Chlorobiaceae bacterium]